MGWSTVREVERPRKAPRLGCWYMYVQFVRACEGAQLYTAERLLCASGGVSELACCAGCASCALPG